MKLMGHSKHETTLRYTHVLEKSQHEAVEKLVEAQ
jgi:site-specific recombinase XerD